MKRIADPFLLFLFLFSSFDLWSQGEVLSPISARIVPQTAKAKSDHNTHFIYQYEAQSLPLMDDFSIDRTRQRWAQPDDPGVTLDQVIQHLVVDGISTPDMAYSLDTTFLYTTDMGEETVTTTRASLPEIIVVVNDLETFPVESETLTVWPPYNLFDTIQSGPPPDTLFLASPDLVQDSLMVYTVAPSTETYFTGSITQPLVLWEDDDVYINGTYPVDPPTIGVATFDGLSRTGMPYDFMNYSSYGIADRLTSVPINLQLPASDSVYLSFFYQARGLSGDIYGQPSDSLVLEFYAPVEDLWYRVWRSPYDAIDPEAQPPFKQVMIPIKEFEFMQNGFKMRFLNYASLSGSFDHWHLDYVRLSAQRTYDDTTIVDVAYVYPTSTLLETYTSVPYNVFTPTAATLMANQVEMVQRNLDDNDRFITYGYQHRLEGGSTQNGPTGTNTSGNASSQFTSVHPVAANGIVYEIPGTGDAAFYETEFWTNATPDINRYNDTTRFIQEISNYYAYDDGSAEMGYGLNTSGAQLAYRFDLFGADSLRAIRMYFSPSANLPPAAHPTTGSFLLTVWSGGSTPGNIIHQNFSFSSPEYRSDGLNHFVEYPLDSTIHVEGTIYIGWVQTNAVLMNIGFDRNRSNQERIFFNVDGNWQNTSFEGSLMMRPVFVSAVDPFTSIAETGLTSDLLLYPNPADQIFHLRSEGLVNGTVELCDATGRVLLRSACKAGSPISIGDLPAGLYGVRCIDTQGTTIGTSRLMIQH